MKDSRHGTSTMSLSEIRDWQNKAHQCPKCGSFNNTPDAMILPWWENNFTCNTCGVRF